MSRKGQDTLIRIKVIVNFDVFPARTSLNVFVTVNNHCDSNSIRGIDIHVGFFVNNQQIVNYELRRLTFGV